MPDWLRVAMMVVTWIAACISVWFARKTYRYRKLMEALPVHHLTEANAHQAAAIVGLAGAHQDALLEIERLNERLAAQ